MPERLQLRATKANIRSLCEFVVRAAEAIGVDAKAIHHCELAVDETLTNVIEHGFTESSVPAQQQYIAVMVDHDSNGIYITLEDNSPPFNPLIHPAPDVDDETYKHQPGGWGIHLVRKIMDVMEYRYHDGRNTLVYGKYFSA